MVTATSRWINVMFRGGKVAVELVTIDDDGHELETKTAAAWKQMKLAADIDGVILRIKTAFRSTQYQQQLRDRYERYLAYVQKNELWERGGKVGPEPEKVPYASLAARPGMSFHEVGQAVDVEGAAMVGSAVETWLGAHCERHGFKRDVPGEPWHCHWIG